MPKLSIIIPAYNAEKYINECIDSILRNSQNSLSQTEIIIINDGSTDHTLEKLEKYKEYKNIHIYTTKNQGVSAARNYGIKLAKGDWITFIDADDKVTRGFIDVCKLNICEETPFVILNQQNKLPLAKEELIKKTLSTENFLAAPFLKLYSTKFLEQEQILFDSRVIIGEDLLFNLSVILKSRKIEYEDIKYYLYRQNNTSATKTFNPKLIESDKNFYKHLTKLFETQKNNQKFYNQLIDCEKTKAILSLITRISFLDNFNEAKTQYQNIDIDFYRPKYQYLNIIQKIILSLMLNKHYLTLFIITKFRTSIGKIRNKGERFIEL